MLTIDLPDGTVVTVAAEAEVPPTIAAKYAKFSIASKAPSELVALQYSSRGFGRMFAESAHKTQLRESLRAGDATVLLYDGTHSNGVPTTLRVIQLGPFEAVDRLPFGISSARTVEDTEALGLVLTPNGLSLDKPGFTVTWKVMLTVKGGVAMRLRPHLRKNTGVPHGLGSLYRSVRDLTPSPAESALGIPKPENPRLMSLVFEANELSATHIEMPQNEKTPASTEEGFIDWSKNLTVFQRS